MVVKSLNNASVHGSSRPSEKGFALLSVLLVVALVSIIAAEMIYQQALDIQRTTNRLNQAQSQAVMAGLGQWIKKGLKLDAQLNEIDHLQEEWAKPLPPVPFAGGEVSGQLFDWQGLLNVNNLGQTDAETRQFWQGVFQRFFQQQGLVDLNLTALIQDWVDADNERLEGGAESDTYLLRQPPFRAANQKMVLPMELGWLEGMTPKLLESIQPSIATLPSVETTLNVNTMPIAVMMALGDWMTEPIAKAWEAARLETPAQEVATFRAFMVQQTGFTEDEINQALPEAYFSVRSDYFYLQGLVSFGVSEQRIDALYYRKDKTQINLIQKWYASLE